VRAIRRPSPLLVFVLVACARHQSPEPRPDDPTASKPEPGTAPRAADTTGAPSSETGGGSADAEKPSGILDPVDGFFMVEGAPAPTACEAASDCLGDTIPKLDDPCCNDPYALRPHAKAYRASVSAWRSEHCVDHGCPPPPAPSQPPDCKFEMACVEGTCRDGCEPRQ